MRNTKTRKLMYLTMLSAMAIAINLLEYTVVPPMPMGVRFGFANIIALITMMLLGVKSMIIVNVMRVVLGNLLRGLLFGMTFWIALGGIVLSSLVLILCRYLKSSVLFTSVLSSVAHIIGQYIVVVLIYDQASIWVLAPMSLFASFAAGILTGIVAQEALKRIQKDQIIKN